MADAVVGALIAFVIASITTPLGVSGAVFLVPAQVSVLHVPNPAVTPTNLLYNLIAIPGALLQFHRGGVLRGGRLVRLLVLGTLPGVIAGAIIRVELVASLDTFYFVIAAVLIPLGGWLALGQPRGTDGRSGGRESHIVLLAVAVGTVGGMYGIGGGSILAPILVGLGYRVIEVAPAALTATFLTSIVGVATYAALSVGAEGDIAPEWLVGIAMGGGGLLGGTLGAWMQPLMPEALLRRGLGVLGLGLGARYALLGLG